ETGPVEFELLYLSVTLPIHSQLCASSSANSIRAYGFRFFVFEPALTDHPSGGPPERDPPVIRRRRRGAVRRNRLLQKYRDTKRRPPRVLAKMDALKPASIKTPVLVNFLTAVNRLCSESWIAPQK